MMLLLDKGNRPNRIGRMLIILIIASSSFFALFATGVQIFFEYRQQRADMDGFVDEVSVFLPPLASSVWTFDERQIGLALEALIHLPHIERVTVVTEGGGNAWVAGQNHSVQLLTRTFPLEYEVRGQTRRIASLEVAGGLDWIFERLFSKILTILISNGMKTFLVAAFMLVVVRRLVTRRIEELADRVVSLIPRMQLGPAATPVGESRPSRPRDEIEALAWTFDDMSERLKLAVADLHDRNADLRREIGERSRVEAELQRMLTELSHTNALLERFAHAAAHDLQEPVRNLVSFSQLLERRHGQQIGAEGREYLEFIVDEAKRLSELVTKLLDYSRSDRRQLRLGDVDCGPLVADVVEDLSAWIERKAAVVAVDPLPRLHADAAQLRQLFHNLISNALKYARPDVSPDVRVVAERQDAAWRFEVADNGIGIDPQYHTYVFELFRRLHTRSAIPGTGIGLALCRRIVENHDGRIWLESVPGEGTRIFFTIPDEIAISE